MPPQQPDGELLIRHAVLGEQDPQPADDVDIFLVVAAGGAGLHVERHRDRVVQLRLLHRLGHEAGDAQLPRPVDVAGPVAAGEHEDRRGGRLSGELAQLLDHREAVDVGHLRVGQDEWVRLAIVARRLERLQGLRGIRGGVDPHAPVVEHLAKDQPVRLVVVDDKHLQPTERLQLRAGGGLVDDPEVGLEGERAALVWLARQLHAAAHQGDQPRRDRQPQPCAAEPSGGAGVGLLEGVEDRGLPVLGDANPGVGDGEPQPDGAAGRVAGRAFGQLHIEHDLALLGELDRVADEVDDDLPQPAGVALHDLRHLQVDVAGQLQSLGMGPHGERLHRVA